MGIFENSARTRTKYIRNMKKLLFVTAFMLCSCLNAFSQATFLTIDCQTPGWLSSMISYEDQQTLESIKIIGYINGNDISFIRNLNLNRSLRGVIDLADANIVSGAGTQDNTMSAKIFANLKPIRKIVLPHTIVNFEYSAANNYQPDQFTNTEVDTLIINGNLQSLSICGGWQNQFWKVRCFYFPEGLTDINFGYLFHRDAGLNNIEIYLPSTLARVGGNNACTDNNTVIHCSSMRPDTIEIKGYQNNNYSFFNNGTLFVPKGTKSLYEQSIFRKLNIIEEVFVEGVFIDNNKKLYVGDKIKMSANVIPSDALEQKVFWKSSNPNVATVSEDGDLEAVTYGATSITVTTKDGGFTDTCEVVVYAHTTGVEIIDRVTIPIDKTYFLNASTVPLSVSDGNIEYSSDNNTIVSVNNEGKILAKKKGICTITATSVDGGYTATCEVTVIQPVEVLAMEKHSVTLRVGDKEKMFAQISPATADNKTVIWASSSERVATVDANGNVAALKAGEAWIKAVSVDNPEAKDSCKVTVTQDVTGIEISQASCELKNIGESIVLTATIEPEDATNKTMTWRSTNESVCVVANGMVVATGFGTAIVMVTTADGGHMAFCTVTVKEVTEEVTLTIKQAESGSVSTKVRKGSVYEMTINVEDGWKLHSVTLNDEDYTEKLSADGKLTTPELTTDSRLSVVYEQDAPTQSRLLSASKVTIQATSQGARVKNAAAGETIYVYSEDGVLQKTVCTTGTETDIPLERDGLYIIKVEDLVVKLRH